MQTAVQFLRSWEAAVFSEVLKKPPPPLPSVTAKEDPKTIEALRRLTSKRSVEREVFKKKEEGRQEAQEVKKDHLLRKPYKP